MQGELEHDQIVAVIKQADIVICTFAYPQVMEQLKIIDAIKGAGNIKVKNISKFIYKDKESVSPKNRWN